MNDPMEHTPYHISKEYALELKDMVHTAKAHCSERADVFINHAHVYPRLRNVYSKLVPVYTGLARAAGAKVHDGSVYISKVKLRHHMHFAEQSNRVVVDMHFDASAAEDNSYIPPTDAEMPRAFDRLSMAPDEEADDDRSSE